MAGKQPKQKETKSEKALGRIGSERYQRFITKLAPLEKEFLTDIADQREERAAQRNMASTDLAAQASGVRQAAGEALPQGGNTLGLADTSLQTGAAAGLNKAQLESDLNTQQASDLQGLVARGSGQAGAAISGLSSAAEAAGRRAADEARLAMANKRAGQQAAMLGLGAAGAIGSSPAGMDFLKNAAGSALGAGAGALGLMSPTGTKTAFGVGADPSGFGLSTTPYPGA